MTKKPDVIDQLLQVSEECILAAPLHTCGCREKVKKLLKVVRTEVLMDAAFRFEDLNLNDDGFDVTINHLKRMAKES